MISKRVLFIAAALLAVSATGAWAAVVDVSSDIDVGTLTINGTSQLYLGLWGIVANTDGSAPDAYTCVRQYINSAYDGGAWDGYGLLNHSAVTAKDQLGVNKGLYNLGLITASDYGTLPGAPTTFHGQTVASYPTTATLIQFTYMGDANLDGLVSPADYALIDAAVARQNASLPVDKTWHNGDFNLSGTISPADYSLIDAIVAYQNSVGTLPTLPSFPRTMVVAGAVPEPSMIVLGLFALAGLVGYRRFSK